MERRNRYTNRIRPMWVFRVVLLGAMLLAAGTTYVLLRNKHVISGDEIRVMENEIAEMDRQIELWELRIAGVRDRQEMTRRLRWVQSDLQPVDSKNILNIAPGTTRSVPVASIY